MSSRPSMTPAPSSCCERCSTYQADRVKLRKSYVKKFNKAIPPKKTVRFFQIDNKLDTIIDFALAKEIPLVN